MDSWQCSGWLFRPQESKECRCKESVFQHLSQENNFKRHGTAGWARRRPRTLYTMYASQYAVQINFASVNYVLINLVLSDGSLTCAGCNSTTGSHGSIPSLPMTEHRAAHSAPKLGRWPKPLLLAASLFRFVFLALISSSTNLLAV
jgi:hypothetical protein